MVAEAMTDGVVTQELQHGNRSSRTSSPAREEGGGGRGGHEIYIASAKRGPKIARRNYLLSAYVSSSLEQLYSNSISIRYVMNDCLILVAVNT